MKELEKLSDSAEKQLRGTCESSIAASEELRIYFKSNVADLYNYFTSGNITGARLDQLNQFLIATIYYICCSFSKGYFNEIIVSWKNISILFNNLENVKINGLIEKEKLCLDKLIAATKIFIDGEIKEEQVKEWLNKEWRLSELTSALPFIALPGMLWLNRNKINDQNIDALLCIINNFLENYLQKLKIPHVYRVSLASQLSDLLLFFAQKKSRMSEKKISGLNYLKKISEGVKNIFNYQHSSTQQTIEELSIIQKQNEFDMLIKNLIENDNKQRKEDKRKKIHQPKNWKLSSNFIETSTNEIISNNEKKPAKPIGIIMYENIEKKKREYVDLLEKADGNNIEQWVDKINNARDEIVNLIKRDHEKNDKNTPVGKFKNQLLAFYEASVKLGYCKFENERFSVNLLDRKNNIERLELLKKDLIIIRTETANICRSICTIQDNLKNLSENYEALRENNIDILSLAVDELLEKQIEFQECIPPAQLIDTIAILTSETTLKIIEQMEILEITQYNLKHTSYFDVNLKEYYYQKIENKIVQLTMLFLESLKEENKPNTIGTLTLDIGNSSLPNESENSPLQIHGSSQLNTIISETKGSENASSILKQQSMATNNTLPQNSQSYFSSQMTFFDKGCSSSQLENINSAEKLFYRDEWGYQDAPTYATMSAYLKDISEVLVKKNLQIKGVEAKAVELHLLILKLFLSSHTDYKIFSRVAMKLKNYFLDKEMDRYFNALSIVELERMADLLDYADVCNGLNNFMSANNLCKEIEKNRNFGATKKGYYYSFLTYLNSVSCGIRHAYDRLEWLENRFRFIAVNLNAMFSHWHLLPRLEQVHLLYSAFSTLSNIFTVLLQCTEQDEIDDRVSPLNEKAQSLYFYLQSLAGISDFRNADSAENKRITDHVYLQKFHLQLRLNDYNPQKSFHRENQSPENELSFYALN